MRSRKEAGLSKHREIQTLSSWGGKPTRVDRVSRVRNLTVCVFAGEDAWGWQEIGYMRPIKCHVLAWLQGLGSTGE